MPEDAPLKVEAWPIEQVIAYAGNLRKRSAAAVDKAATSVATTPWRSALRRRRRLVQQLLRPCRSDGPVSWGGHPSALASSPRSFAPP
jgi:hypothetical protein